MILPRLQGRLDNPRGNIETILLFAWWRQERLRCWSQGPLYRQKQRMLAGCWKPISFAGAGPSWHLERFALSDHILLCHGGPEVNWWQRGSQSGSKTHCRRSTKLHIRSRVFLCSHMAIHMYGHKHTPQDTDAAQGYLGAASDQSFEKFSSSRINCTHGPNKFNIIKSAKFKA